MNRAERRRLKRKLRAIAKVNDDEAWEKFRGLGRDEDFRRSVNPIAHSDQQAIFRGEKSSHGKEGKGGNKGGSWGPEADGGGFRG